MEEKRIPSPTSVPVPCRVAFRTGRIVRFLLRPMILLVLALIAVGIGGYICWTGVPKRLFEQGQRAEQAGRLDEAESLYRECVREHDWLPAKVGLLCTLNAQCRYDEVITLGKSMSATGKGGKKYPIILSERTEIAFLISGAYAWRADAKWKDKDFRAAAADYWTAASVLDAAGVSLPTQMLYYRNAVKSLWEANDFARILTWADVFERTFQESKGFIQNALLPEHRQAVLKYREEVNQWWNGAAVKLAYEVTDSPYSPPKSATDFERWAVRPDEHELMPMPPDQVARLSGKIGVPKRSDASQYVQGNFLNGSDWDVFRITVEVVVKGQDDKRIGDPIRFTLKRLVTNGFLNSQRLAPQQEALMGAVLDHSQHLANGQRFQWWRVSAMGRPHR